ncbi:MAG TPA: pilus assembly protein PilM, partial [Patescibacteria group bacterium]|nr:pilus assembly protein PilM [Patescibacteria group bacterium]
MRPIVFGIDISDRSIEIVSLLQRKGRLGIAFAGRREIPAGVIERGLIQDADVLVKILVGFFDALFGERRGKLVAGAALPAAVVYSKSFVMPAGLDVEQLRKAVAIEASDVFPVPLQDAVDDIVVAPQAEEGPQDVFYALASGDVARAYRSVLVRAGAQPLFLDSEDFALVRGVGASHPAEPVLVVDVGNRTTLLVIADRNGVRMSSSIPFGAEKLVEALEKRMKVGFAESEKLLRTQGFDPAAGDGRMFLVLQQPTEELIAEIRKTIQYAERRFGPKVRAVLLSGGTSLVPGLVEYLASNFQDVAVGRGDPFRGIATDAAEETVDAGTANLYGAAVGLAARAIGARESPGLNLLPHAARDGTGPLAGVKRVLGAITSSLSMATHAKKSHPKKKRAEAEERPAAQAPEPAVQAAEELPAELSAAAAPAAPAEEQPQEAETPAPAEPAPTVADVTPPELVQPAAPTPAPAAPEAPEEPDFGLGIGDILREEEEIQTQKVDLDAKGGDAKGDEGKLSIEDILNRGSAPAPAKAAKVVAKKKPVFVPRPPRDRSGLRKIAPLVVLVLLCFAAAAAGIYMFVKKNGLPTFPAKKPAASAPAPAPAPSTAEAPASVSVTVLVGTTAKPAGDKPFLVTRVVETDVKASDTFTATGTSTTAAGKASGKATIINTTSHSYTFVATTRLLSKEGVLFRMKAASPIPANGSVTVAVAADQPGPAGDIGPTTFTIPGLPPDLQK